MVYGRNADFRKQTGQDRTCPVKRSGAGNGDFPEPECTNPPKSVINLAEDQISGGPKAGAMPVKDYNACTIENNTRPP